MHLIIQKLRGQNLHCIKICKRHKIKDHSDKFRIVCDPSSGSIKLYLTEIHSSSLMFVVCLIGVWQRNFELVVCVYCMMVWELVLRLLYSTHSQVQLYTPWWWIAYDLKHVRVIFNFIIIYYYWYSALGPVWAETRVQSGDWYGSGTLDPGQVLRG